MPYLKLSTNVPLSKEQTPTLLKQFSELMAQETSKPERYVLVEVSGGNAMVFGGSSDPLAFVECKNIGMSASQAKSLSASVSQILNSALQIPQDRVYIEFSNATGSLWGWNGSTFG